MLKTYKICNSTVKFPKYEFNNKLLGGVTLLNPLSLSLSLSIYIDIYIRFTLLIVLLYQILIINHKKILIISYQGWQWGKARLKDGVFIPAKHGFVLPHLCPVSHDEENFLTPSPPLGAPLHPIKLYFLLIFLTTSTIFLMKPISLIKIYLKLQLNLSYQIK